MANHTLHIKMFKTSLKCTSNFETFDVNVKKCSKFDARMKFLTF